MSKATTNDDEQMNDWHGLPSMIGDAIITDEYCYHSWGGYLVRREDDGTLRIYRVVDSGYDRDELEGDRDIVAPMGDYYEAGVEIGHITAPEDGWDSEVEPLPEDIFGGFE